MRRSSTSTDRVARTLALLLAVVAVAAAATAWLIQRHSDTARSDASAQLPPSLVTTAPRSKGEIWVPSRAAPSPTTSARNDGTGRTAHRPRRPVTIVPQHLFVPSIGVNTAVTAKPTELAEDPFVHRKVPSFGVPDDMYTATWWSSGPRPGSTGMAVVLGHTQVGGYGVFNRLGAMRPGQLVGVTRGRHSLRFSVVSVRTGIPKRDPTALQSVLSAHPRSAGLALVTCSGTFDGTYRASAENTVVFARLVSAH